MGYTRIWISFPISLLLQFNNEPLVHYEAPTQYGMYEFSRWSQLWNNVSSHKALTTWQEWALRAERKFFNLWFYNVLVLWENYTRLSFWFPAKFWLSLKLWSISRPRSYSHSDSTHHTSRGARIYSPKIRLLN